MMAGRGCLRYWDNALHEASLRRWSRIARQAAQPTLTICAPTRRARGRFPPSGRRDVCGRFPSGPSAHRFQCLCPPARDGLVLAARSVARPLPVQGIAGVTNRTELGDEVKVFHDCPRAEIGLRQIRNHDAADLAPFALALDVFGFDGSFLSLAVELPPDAAHGLRKSHLLRVEVTAHQDRPVEMFARLNIRHGPIPNRWSRTSGLTGLVVEFDLAYTNLNEKRVESLWLDLIIDRPSMNRIVFKDLTFARYPRADI